MGLYHLRPDAVINVMDSIPLLESSQEGLVGRKWRNISYSTANQGSVRTAPKAKTGKSIPVRLKEGNARDARYTNTDWTYFEYASPLLFAFMAHAVLYARPHNLIVNGESRD
jgi:hypothetical protein